MISFLIALAALIAGYFLYGRFVDRVFGPDPKRQTPALTKADGVDYIPMPAWKVYMIQFLNIAGTGPIFGAIMGAMFGPAAFLWIVFGCIFAGAVHDYFTGMLSVRHGGVGFPEIVGHYLGGGTKKVMLVFSILLLLLVGTVFVYSPAQILGPMTDAASWFGITGEWAASFSKMFWVGIILLYYIVATLLPVDQVIGRFYPLFAFALLFMAIALGVCLFIKWPAIPEIWEAGGQYLKGPDAPIFPCLFITIACGAVSGFHATQSPLMARCIKDERLGRPVFYGAMITEGIVALIWAAVASWFFFDGGKELLGATATDAPSVVTYVSKGWLGVIGGILAILGVVAAPITSGDTAFRSARLIIADFLHLNQKPIRNRLLVSIPLFVICAGLLAYNIADANGFNKIWNYFGWSNQTLAVFTLWTATVYLTVTKPRGSLSFLIGLVPAVFMTAVCTAFICISTLGLNLPADWNYAIGGTAAAVSLLLFAIWHRLRSRKL